MSARAWPTGGSEMAELIRTHPWEKTSLGPPEGWPARLRAAVDLMLPNGFPMTVLWGPDLIQIYNDGYCALMGVKHPVGLGQPTRDCWPEVRHINEPIYERVWQGETHTFEDALYPIARSGTLEDAWFTLSYSPLRTDGGMIGGILVTLFETTGRKRAEMRRDQVEAALRESQARLAAIFTNASVGLSEVGLDGRFLRVNDELCRILDRTREEVLQTGVPGVTYAPDVQPSLEAVAGAARTGRPASLDKRYRRPSGELVWASSTVTPLLAPDGSLDRFLVVTADLTARRRAEQALRESEERLRLAIGVGGLATWDWNLLTGDVAWSDEHYAMCGYAVGEIAPSFEAWAARVHREDLPATLAALEQARDNRRDFLHEFRCLHPDGSVRWCSARGRFFYDEAGTPVRMIGVVSDVTERRTWEERQGVLIAELQHRTRNLLSVVRSVADKTLAGSAGLEDFRERFRARLAALSRVNGLLSRLNENDRIAFDELIRTELLGHGVIGPDGRGAQVALQGPTGIRLRSTTVQTFALGLHELATNALKYGALSRPEGRLLVRWTLRTGERGEPCLRVEWEESGVPVERPAEGLPSRGYGRELIERALPYQLGAQTCYELRPEGVRCTIVLPISTHRTDAAEA